MVAHDNLILIQYPAVKQLSIGSDELGLLARMLRGVDFFTPLTVGQLEQILPHIMLYSFGAGERVFKQGEAGDAFYIVYKGSVEVKIKFSWWRPAKTVAKMGQGQFFGEIALISNEPRTATLDCAEPSELFVLIARDFQSVLGQNPAAAEEMARIAARRKFQSKQG